MCNLLEYPGSCPLQFDDRVWPHILFWLHLPLDLRTGKPFIYLVSCPTCRKTIGDLAAVQHLNQNDYIACYICGNNMDILNKLRKYQIDWTDIDYTLETGATVRGDSIDTGRFAIFALKTVVFPSFE